MKKILFLAVAFAASAVRAYAPPADETNGVRVAIQTFDQFYDSNPVHGDRQLGVVDVDTARPRPFTVTVENRSADAVSGELAVEMNGDWEIAFDPTNGGRVAAMRTERTPTGALDVRWLVPREVRSFAFVARAKASAVDGLYPVHARFTRNGAGPHAVGVFHAVKRAEAAAGSASELARMKGDDPDEKKEIPGVVRTPDAVPLAVAPSPGARWTVTPGAKGLADATLRWTDGTRAIAFSGFDVAVRAKDAAGADAAPRPTARATATGDVLRVTVSLPAGATRADGFPRLASVMPRGADAAVGRVYFGFGNVLEGVKRLTVNANGFELSTRHIGADYANGVSVVQATDVVPDAMEVDPARNLCSIRAPHDVTFTFVAGTNGAFAAARRFASVSGYRASPGHDALAGRMCLDEWFTYDYDKVARLLAAAGDHGLNRSVLVKHAWQRWLYDVRLPDIWPPAGGVGAFLRMRRAAEAAGILFVPHDNYTDFYPDADGFSYDHVAFRLDGRVQESWYNSWMHSLAVRWAPGAYLPWTRRNARLLRDGARPDGVFIDVLTCLQPFDWLDRKGVYHSRQETSRGWGAAFEAYRETFGNDRGFVTISEAGQDHLVGIADGGQSDHLMAEKAIGSGTAYADAERVPWHDMVTHGKFVLFAGGIASRYLERRWGKGGDAEAHGYGSDDYLVTTVIGGRNPMCGLLDFRKAVKTYWLQQAVCEELARAEMLSFEFGPTIHQQHAVFSGGAEVWVNRATNVTWRLANGVELPSYGYYTKSPDNESGVVLRNGRRARYAKGRDFWYVEACEGTVDFGGIVTDGAFRLDLRGAEPKIRPLPETTRGFAYDIDLPTVRTKGRWPDADKPDGGAAPRARGMTFASPADVRLNDAFWSPKFAVWRAVTVGDVFDKFEGKTRQDGVRDDWIANFDHVAAGERANGSHKGPHFANGLVYEAIRGASDYLLAQPDPALKARLAGYAARIAAAQATEPDGYLNTHNQLCHPQFKWGENGGCQVSQHEIWNLGMLIEAGVHHERATGDVTLLDAAVRAANLLCDTIGPAPKRNRVPTHSGPEEAVLVLARRLRENPGLAGRLSVPARPDDYVRLVDYWMRARGRNTGTPVWGNDFGAAANWISVHADEVYSAADPQRRPCWGDYAMDRLPLADYASIEGHAVRATLLGCGLATLARDTGDALWATVAGRLWDSMAGRKMYVTGGVGALADLERFGPDYHLPPAAYLETCAAIGSAFYSARMAELTGDGRYVDEMERVLYNALLTAVSLDGRRYTYENPLESRSHNRWDWHWCPCCPPMFLKLTGALPGYVYATDRDGIRVNLYATGSAELPLADGRRVTLTQATRYPYDGKVAVSVGTDAAFTLRLRVPGWARGEENPFGLYSSGAVSPPRLAVNGVDVPASVEAGYVALTRAWRAGDTVTLALDCSPRVVRAHPSVAAVAGKAAVASGPLVYAFERTDNPGWDALSVPPAAALRAEYRPDLLGGVNVVTDGKGLAAIPYFAVANRGTNVTFGVWMNAAETKKEAVEDRGFLRVRGHDLVD